MHVRGHTHTTDVEGGMKSGKGRGRQAGSGGVAQASPEAWYTLQTAGCTDEYSKPQPLAMTKTPKV